MIYYTADLHLGHEHIIQFCNRPFDSVEEMDRALIANWNQRVRPDDTVYIVGDLMFHAKRPAKAYLSEMKGHKILVTGNHDHSWLKDDKEARACFDEIANMLLIQDGNDWVTLCHYPMMTWSKEQKGAYMVYGHIHSHTNHLDFWPEIVRKERMLNAGVDVNHFVPVTLQEMIANNRIFRYEQPADDIPSYDTHKGVWKVSIDGQTEEGPLAEVVCSWLRTSLYYPYHHGDPAKHPQAHGHCFEQALREALRNPETFSTAGLEEYYSSQERELLRQVKEKLTTIELERQH